MSLCAFAGEWDFLRLSLRAWRIEWLEVEDAPGAFCGGPLSRGVAGALYCQLNTANEGKRGAAQPPGLKRRGEEDDGGWRREKTAAGNGGRVSTSCGVKLPRACVKTVPINARPDQF